MKIISFSWTTPAVKARRKSVTRRDWDRGYAQSFQKGELVQAYDRSPRVGGKRFGTIRILEKPYVESTDEIPDSDWEGEGFAYLESIGASIDGTTPRGLWESWKLTPIFRWVIRFEIVEIFGQKANGNEQWSELN
jgi:hypothetical protein